MTATKERLSGGIYACFSVDPAMAISEMTRQFMCRFNRLPETARVSPSAWLMVREWMAREYKTYNPHARSIAYNGVTIEWQNDHPHNLLSVFDAQDCLEALVS